LPLALALVLGLLAGVAGGYAVWGRTGAGPVSPAPPTGREYSEQVVKPQTGQSSVPGKPAAESAPASPTVPSRSAGSSAASSTASKPASGRAGTIVIRSTPSGAGVTVNGTWRGRTPLTLDELPFARYQVRVVQTGYLPATEAVALTADEPVRSLSFRLRQPARAAPRAGGSTPADPPAAGAPQQFTGSIYVDSRPRGARVSLNGKPVGVTPLRIADVRIGAHVVRLELPEYRVWSSSARVAAGRESRVTGSLERIQ
jgi:hypothetical protein